MNDPDLRKLLEQLHHEIEQTKTVDARGRELLSDLGTDIRELLERSENSPLQPRPTTIRRMEDSISYLEVTHPTLTTLLSKLLATLSNAGI
jgi:hypothetical protein